MNESVVLVGEDSVDFATIKMLLEKAFYRPIVVSSLKKVEKAIGKKPCLAALIDFDTVPLNNKTIKSFKQRVPGLSLIIISEKKYHPELKEAITDHIYACVSKPVDPDELEYWLASIHRNETRSRDTPARA